MTLRAQIQWLVTGLAIAMFMVVAALNIVSSRAAVKEEVEAANRVALQFIARYREMFAAGGITAAEPVIRELGRIRSNEMELIAADGSVRYRSPPATYKAGRHAPAWFASMLGPGIIERSFAFGDGRLVVRTDPSRALLDGWDELRVLLGVGALVIVLAAIGSYLVARRVLSPVTRVIHGLQQARAGHFGYRIDPPRGGAEARALAQAFNGLMQAVEERDRARALVLEAQEQRDLSRDMALRFERELEQERRALARDLHDELGQHATALKTLAATFEKRLAVSEPSLAQLASLMIRSADALFAAIRSMINRVRPEALERGGLVDGLRTLTGDWKLRKPDMRFELLLAPADDRLFGLGEPEIESAAYRIVQEAITNAVRHARATTVIVSASAEAGWLIVQISDDGPGFGAGEAASRDADDPARSGSGLANMRERALALGGEFSCGNGESGGAEVIVRLPWPAAPSPRPAGS